MVSPLESLIMAEPFHLAFPVRDLTSTRHFYVEVLGCRLGRSGEDWQDIDFFGSQIVAHESIAGSLAIVDTNEIDDNEIPLPHFGAVLEMEDWRALEMKLLARQVSFLIPPHVRYEGTPREQASLFLCDPSGNVLEFKAFKDPGRMFEV
jgi:extradiol dioxygenase family protein